MLVALEVAPLVALTESRVPSEERQMDFLAGAKALDACVFAVSVLQREGEREVLGNPLRSAARQRFLTAAQRPNAERGLARELPQDGH